MRTARCLAHAYCSPPVLTKVHESINSSFGSSRTANEVFCVKLIWAVSITNERPTGVAKPDCWQMRFVHRFPSALTKGNAFVRGSTHLFCEPLEKKQFTMKAAATSRLLPSEEDRSTCSHSNACSGIAHACSAVWHNRVCWEKIVGSRDAHNSSSGTNKVDISQNSHGSLKKQKKDYWTIKRTPKFPKKSPPIEDSSHH